MNDFKLWRFTDVSTVWPIETCTRDERLIIDMTRLIMKWRYKTDKTINGSDHSRVQQHIVNDEENVQVTEMCIKFNPFQLLHYDKPDY